MKKLLLTIAPAIAGVTITLSYLPQLYLTLSTKNVEGQSLFFWLLLNISLLGLLLQQIGMVIYHAEKNYTGVVVQAVNFSFSLVMTILILIYR